MGTERNSEDVLRLLNRQVEDLKFRRQHSLSNYIVDFYCPEIRLIIELDGAAHDNYLSEERDEKRDRILQELSCTILRFENRYVYEFLSEIIEAIKTQKEYFYNNQL